MTRGKSSLLLIFVLLFIGMILTQPSASLQAALQGIAIWWDILFPALLPFLVLAELMLGFGIVHFIGTLLDPWMRPLFRVPGTGGFVLAMGFASGYPIAAKLVAQLRKDKEITRDEGERLVAFCTTADPIFLIGAVSVGFFHSPQIAPILIISHYGAALIVGLIIRYHGRSQHRNVQLMKAKRFAPHRLKSAFSAMHQARLANPIPFGQLLGRSVEAALEVMFLLGGLVVFMSVLLELITLSGIMTLFYHLTDHLLDLLKLPISLSKPLLDGIFEVTLGVKTTAETITLTPLFQMMTASFIVSWGGLSVHAQVVGLLTQTDLSYRPFLFARMMHGFFAALLTLVIWPYVMI